MNNNKPFSYQKLIIFLVPAISLFWGFYTYATSLPFFIKGSDPEYPYLINGLNFALLHFDRIGHTDHPGTPFQLFIGIIIRLTHLFAGKDSITNDVLSRPEFYLGAVSISLTIVQSVLVFLIGKIGLKNHKLIPILILQLTPFYHSVLINLYGRCTPDRFFILVTLLFLIVLLKYSFNKKPNELKLAIWTGVVMGLGFATKINYFPVLILPLFILSNWKYRGIYAGAGFLSIIVFIAPILQKFPEFRRFIAGIVNHDGLYGSGESKAFNLEKIIANIKSSFYYNPEFFLFLGLIVLLVIVLSIKKPAKRKQNKLFLLGYFILFAIQLIMVTKHFKNYYFTPLFSTYGLFIFVVVLQLQKLNLSKKVQPLINISIPAIFIITSFYWLYKDATNPKIDLLNAQRIEVALFVKNQIDKNNYWFVEPTWESGPYVENALVYGLSYCANRSDYEPNLKHINPHILTYEGQGNSIRLWRSSFASLDTVLISGSKINLLSTSSRHANELSNMIKNVAGELTIPIIIDTVFSQPQAETYIIEITPDISTTNVDSLQNILKKKYENKQSEFEQKISYFIKSIKESPDWLASVQKKAIKKGISLDSMIYLDAVYMANQN